MNTERINLVAPCGIDCGICELYACRDNPQLHSALLSKGIPADKIPCDGCRPTGGGCPIINGKCKTFECLSDKNLKFCFECSDFPCTLLQPCADRADVLPHNLKVYNLCTVKNKGVEAFVNESLSIKQKYYKGKMSIGKGPQI